MVAFGLKVNIYMVLLYLRTVATKLLFIFLFAIVTLVSKSTDAPLDTFNSLVTTVTTVD
jgi:hypothetical protein